VNIKKVPIGTLIESPYNPRTISDSDLAKLKTSIVEFGYVEPIIVNKRTGHIVGGNQRYKALKALGHKEIEIVEIDVDKIKEKQLNIALNKIEGEWEVDKLEEVLKEIEGEVGDFDLTGFDEEELDDLLKELVIEEDKADVTEDDYEVPEQPKNTFNIQAGDIWQLGEHRLMCGDATVKEDVEKLMGGVSADMVFTDPPYGNLVITNKKGEVGKSNVAKVTQYHVYMNEGNFDFEPCWKIIEGWDCKKVIWGGNYFVKCLPITTSWIVWDKRAGEHSWYSDCELAWTNLGIPAKIYSITWQGMIREGESDKRVHPTQKPIELASKIISKQTGKNIIVDLFGGSGSTLIACEQLNRKCYMMEIDPHYCSVIIDRWQKFTEKEAQKLGQT